MVYFANGGGITSHTYYKGYTVCNELSLKERGHKKIIRDINVGVIGKNMVAKIPELSRHFSCFIYQQGAKIKKKIHTYGFGDTNLGLCID